MQLENTNKAKLLPSKVRKAIKNVWPADFQCFHSQEWTPYHQQNVDKHAWTEFVWNGACFWDISQLCRYFWVAVSLDEAHFIYLGTKIFKTLRLNWGEPWQLHAFLLSKNIPKFQLYINKFNWKSNWKSNNLCQQKIIFLNKMQLTLILLSSVLCCFSPPNVTWNEAASSPCH